ncbi:MAG: glycosyltransferase, partial [Pseudomonadota bacterium]
TANAKGLSTAGGAIVIPESRLAVDTLSEQIATVLTNPKGAQQMAHAALSVAMPDAAAALADITEDLARSSTP